MPAVPGKGIGGCAAPWALREPENCRGRTALAAHALLLLFYDD